MGHDWEKAGQTPLVVTYRCTRCGNGRFDPITPVPEVPVDPPVGEYSLEESEEDVSDGEVEIQTEVSEPEANAAASTTSSQLLESVVTTQYSYVYNGSSLSQMTITTTVDDAAPTKETLYFAYDASGTPMSVTYNGTNYYYATNIQGDVTAILNTSGTAVVQYTYDAWGKNLTTTGTMADTLGVHNPLRYRGYVYDTETTLYYLQSRYYNPELKCNFHDGVYTNHKHDFLACTLKY